MNVYVNEYWPFVCFPPTVGKCDTSQRNRHCLQVENCCVFTVFDKQICDLGVDNHICWSSARVVVTRCSNDEKMRIKMYVNHILNLFVAGGS